MPYSLEKGDYSILWLISEYFIWKCHVFSFEIKMIIYDLLPFSPI